MEVRRGVGVVVKVSPMLLGRLTVTVLWRGVAVTALVLRRLVNYRNNTFMLVKRTLNRRSHETKPTHFSWDYILCLGAIALTLQEGGGLPVPLNTHTKMIGPICVSLRSWRD